MPEPYTVVDVYDSRVVMEGAIHALRDTRFDMKNLSIVGTDVRTEEHLVGLFSVAGQTTVWGRNGPFWSSLCGCLVGAGLFLVPDIGHVIVLGPLVDCVVGALDEGSAGPGMGLVGAALVRAGLSESAVGGYESALRTGKFIVTVHGSYGEIHSALQTLANGALTAQVAVRVEANDGQIAARG